MVVSAVPSQVTIHTWVSKSPWLRPSVLRKSPLRETAPVAGPGIGRLKLGVPLPVSWPLMKPPVKPPLGFQAMLQLSSGIQPSSSAPKRDTSWSQTAFGMSGVVLSMTLSR